MYVVSILEGDSDYLVTTRVFVTEDKGKAYGWVSRFNDLIIGYQEWLINHPRYNDPNDDFIPYFHDWTLHYKPYAYVEEVNER